MSGSDTPGANLIKLLERNWNNFKLVKNYRFKVFSSLSSDWTSQLWVHDSAFSKNDFILHQGSFLLKKREDFSNVVFKTFSFSERNQVLVTLKNLLKLAKMQLSMLTCICNPHLLKIEQTHENKSLFSRSKDRRRVGVIRRPSFIRWTDIRCSDGSVQASVRHSVEDTSDRCPKRQDRPEVSLVFVLAPRN